MSRTTELLSAPSSPEHKSPSAMLDGSSVWDTCDDATKARAVMRQLAGVMVEAGAPRLPALVERQFRQLIVQMLESESRKTQQFESGLRNTLRAEMLQFQNTFDQERHDHQFTQAALQSAQEKLELEERRAQASTAVHAMLRESHCALVDSNKALLQQLQESNSRHAIEAQQWQQNFAVLQAEIQTMSSIDA